MTVKSSDGAGILGESILTDLDGLGGLVLMTFTSPFALVYFVMSYGWNCPFVTYLLPFTCLCTSLLCTILVGGAISRFPNHEKALTICLVMFQLLSLGLLIWCMAAIVSRVIHV